MSTNNSNAPTSTTKLSDVPDYRPQYIPKSTYWHSVKDAEFGKSKSTDNPMYTLKVEIIDHPGFPDPKTPGSIIDPNGTEATVYLSLTEKALANLKNFFRGCGLPLDISLADLIANPNPNLFKGLKFLAVGYSEAKAQVDETTNQPIKNPATGQDVVFYNYKVGQVFPKA